MESSFNVCQFQDCDQSTGRSGHYLCRDHYYESQRGEISLCAQCPDVYKPSEYPVCRDCFRTASPSRQQRTEWPTPAKQPDRTTSILRNEIEAVKRNLVEHAVRIRNSEQATRDYCIRPILRGLGWDVESPDEVEPERRISQGYRRAPLRVDYALLIDSRPVIYVEAKRHGIGYDSGWADQLRRYTDDLGSGYGVLTNGQMWMILQVDDGRDTLLDTADILKGTSNAESVLNRYLAKSIFTTQESALTKARAPSGSWPTPTTRRSQALQTTPPRARRQASDEDLRERLLAYRNRASGQYRIPAYMVFSNKAIDGIIAARPKNARQLSAVSGVGLRTLDSHGKAILSIVNDS